MAIDIVLLPPHKQNAVLHYVLENIMKFQPTVWMGLFSYVKYVLQIKRLGFFTDLDFAAKYVK